jgi:hypothetical protein
MTLDEFNQLIKNTLEETIKKVAGKYVVYPKKGGKRLGTHSSRSAALKQLGAIEASKARHENINEKSVPEPYDRYNARKMTASQINRRDKIGKKMLKQKSTMSYFKDNYGDDWESWLWAAATTIAMRGE